MQYKFQKPIVSTIKSEKYQSIVEWRNGKFTVDEPVSIGGKDTGPDPYTLLLSSLASCKIVTLRIYIDKKGWDIPIIKAKANLFQKLEKGESNTVIDCDISFPNAVVSIEKKEELLEVAEKCPVSKIIDGNTKVRSFIYLKENIENEKVYSNKEISVIWKGELCKHSGRCVTQLPEVFNLKAQPWINVDGANAKTIKAQVLYCPTGALSLKPNLTTEF